jgi:hypothetical protein
VVLAALGAAGDEARLRTALGEMGHRQVSEAVRADEGDAIDELLVYLDAAYKCLTPASRQRAQLPRGADEPSSFRKARHDRRARRSS